MADKTKSTANIIELKLILVYCLCVCRSVLWQLTGGLLAGMCICVVDNLYNVLVYCIGPRVVIL